MNQQKPKPEPENQNDDNVQTRLPYCGIIMPIAAMPPEYDTAHWARIKGQGSRVKGQGSRVKGQGDHQ
jgi:hypothetical protein